MNLMKKHVKHFCWGKSLLLLPLLTIYPLNLFASDITSPIDTRARQQHLYEKGVNMTQQQKERTITGVVKDKNGESIVGTNVVIKGSTKGSMTDVDGKFSLQVPEDAILQVSYIGYKTAELPVGKQSFMNIFLTEDTEMLEEVVVVGYGTTKRRDVVGSISKISSDDIVKVSVANVAESLQGMSSGVMVTNSSGHPGAAP